MLHAYRPSNRVSLPGLIVLALVAICGGLVFGGLAAAISNFIWLIVLFPIGLGLAAGELLAKMITKYKVRSPMAAAAAALLMSLMIYGTMNYADYLVFQSELSDLITEEYGQLDNQTVAEITDGFLGEETGFTGFLGYLRLQAQEGVAIGSFRSSQALTLNEPLSWLYWLVELIIVTVCATLIAVERAKKPFCELCQCWYGGGEHQGSVARDNVNQFLELMRTGNMRQASALLTSEPLPSPTLEIYMRRCPRHDEHQSVLTIQSTWLDAKGKTQFKDELEGLIMPYEAGSFRQSGATA
jgi:hypothetical protein